jgi:hypothetical protein
MKRITAIVFIGLLTALAVRMGYPKPLAEWLIKPGGSPPIITHSFAREEITHGDFWRIYLEAEDPDGDMRRFVCTFWQIAYGYYPSEYVLVKKRDREKMKGYLTFPSYLGAGPYLPEWTQLRLTVYIQDKGGNTSNKLVFPLVLSRGSKREPPPPPFDAGGLDKLGTIAVELINPEWNGNDEREP